MYVIIFFFLFILINFNALFVCLQVRGVGAGGVISTAYCLLYKLHEMHISRRQLENLLNHRDSPYIRGLGFLYIRYRVIFCLFFLYFFIYYSLY